MCKICFQIKVILAHTDETCLAAFKEIEGQCCFGAFER